MSKYSFSKQKSKAYYFNTIPGFIKDSSQSILGSLVRNAYRNSDEQIQAWDDQIQDLQKRLEECGMEGDIIFEYDIIRLGKRIDVVLLIRNMVFSLEFKNGQKIFTAKDAQQAEDYALDIKNFHKESENLYVCPILIATEAPKYNKSQSLSCYPDKQIYLQRENIETLIPKLNEIVNLYSDDSKIDFDRWFNSEYHPTPSIVEAAVEAYATHDISQIARSEAGQDDIEKCELQIREIIDYAKENDKKCLCFVTGVPGAGKTLVGLNIAVSNLQNSKSLSVYLSGNGPLVEVLQEALIKSAKEKKQLNRETSHAIKGLIQGSYQFKKEYAGKSIPNTENILIFDEAQRVWNEKKMISKHEGDASMSMSEPKLILSIMDRHQDWAVIICLVGLGQDIHDGEVGINEWFSSAIKDFPHWEIFYSPEIFHQQDDKAIDRSFIEDANQAFPKENLHLNVSVRTFRASQQADFVSALLDNKPEVAADLYKEFVSSYPIYITRDIRQAKKWVKRQVRGSQRSGLLASSSAQRLRPEGIFVTKEVDVKSWFLAPSNDVRSSNMLEIAASEFKVQGLEVDWAVVCWDQDLRRSRKGNWDHYNFRGTKWMHRNKEDHKRYLENAYRVLLTRARQGMVIFVPEGTDAEEDETRLSDNYDAIYKYLLSCGIPELPNQ